MLSVTVLANLLQAKWLASSNTVWLVLDTTSTALVLVQAGPLLCYTYWWGIAQYTPHPVSVTWYTDLPKCDYLVDGTARLQATESSSTLKWKPEVSEVLASEEELCCVTFVVVSCSENWFCFACIYLFIYENIMQNITLRYVRSLLLPLFTHLPSEFRAFLFAFTANVCVAALMEMSW